MKSKELKGMAKNELQDKIKELRMEMMNLWIGIMQKSI